MRATILLTLLFVGCRPMADSPLARAAAAGAQGEVEALLASGADPNAPGGRGVMPLHAAARNGRVGVIGALVRAGAAIDRRDEAANGWTPLMHAIHKNRPEAARALLEAGADPNARSRGGTSALLMAAGYGQTVIVRELLARGADPRAEMPGGQNALWAAAGGGAIADITDGPPLGTCFPATVALLREKAPDLRLGRGFATRALSWLARSPECSDLLRHLPRR